MNLLKNEYGITLIEICVVAALLAIGAATCVWSLAPLLPDLRLKATVRNLKTDMQLARLIAIRENTRIVSDFSLDRNCYTIFRDDGGGDRSNANNYFLDDGEEVVKFVSLHPKIRMCRAKFGSVFGKFAFNCRGSVDGLSGGVYFKNNDNDYRGVAVSRIGKLTIKKSFDGKVWQSVQ